jgi:glycerophosphoryl diester phosphodiesterase
VRRVGHKGADLLAPGNTPESFERALEAGADMIEFDVLPERARERGTSRLLLAHDYEQDLSGATELEDGLAHLASLDIDLDVDLKLPGYEDRVVDALRRHGLLERSLATTQYMRSLVRLRELEPALRLGWSVPRARRDYTASRLYLLPALAALARIRRRLPDRAAAHLRAGRCDVVMAHWRVTTPALVGAVHSAGGELFVWTVDDAVAIRRFARLGVDGVVTNDPGLFGAAEAAPAETSPGALS